MSSDCGPHRGGPADSEWAQTARGALLGLALQQGLGPEEKLELLRALQAQVSDDAGDGGRKVSDNLGAGGSDPKPSPGVPRAVKAGGVPPVAEPLPHAAGVQREPGEHPALSG